MKRISIIVGCMVLLVVGIFVFTSQDQEQVLVEDDTLDENTSLVFMLQEEDGMDLCQVFRHIFMDKLLIRI